MKYLVIEWDTDKTLKEFDNLNKAKKYCKNLGHAPYNKWYIAYPPVAFVGFYDEKYQGNVLIYNPRFAFEKGFKPE